MQCYIEIGDQGCQQANDMGAVTIIVDALRASATLAALMHRGVEEVWVVGEVEEAWRLKAQVPDALLVGERNSVKLPGFDFSNSPADVWSSKPLVGRKAIFTSTTGAKRLLACRQAAAVLVGSSVNATAVAQAARLLAQKFQRPVVIVASGVYGQQEPEWAEEDIAAAWVIADRLGLPIAAAPERPSGDLIGVFSKSLHGQELLALGLEEDVHWCAQVDVVSAVPWVVAFHSSAAQLHRWND